MHPVDDLKQKVDQRVYHLGAAVHEMEREEPQPPRFAVAAHLGRGLTIDPPGQALNQSGIDIGHGVERQTERVHECQAHCCRQDALQSGGTRIRFQTQEPRGAFGIGQAGLQFPACLTGQAIGNPRKKVFNGIVPSPADQPLHDLVRRHEISPRAALAIPEFDLVLDLPERPLKHLGQFVPQRLPVPIRGAPNTQMPQDCRPVPTRGHMTILEIPLVWGRDPQLLGKVLHDIGRDIT